MLEDSLLRTGQSLGSMGSGKPYSPRIARNEVLPLHRLDGVDGERQGLAEGNGALDSLGSSEDRETVAR
jgi:hypothetical protein